MKTETNGAGFLALQRDRLHHAKRHPHALMFRSWGTRGNTLPELFAEGFRTGICLWKAGETFESISQLGENVRDDTCEAAGRGLYAASEALAGWYDVAEREARAWGLSPEAARSLAIEARDTREL